MSSPVKKEPFGKAKDGSQVMSYTLQNSKGMVVKVLDYGATITEIHVPDKDGKFDDINLSLDSMEDYATKNLYFGALVGRVAGRIANGQFTLDGETYQLAVNNGPNALHGGKVGFGEKIWKAEIQGNKVAFSLFSPDGEEGYPGDLYLTVTYSVEEDNTLSLDYQAYVKNKATPINLTNHAYFNLGGHSTNSLDDHVLTLHADHYLPSTDTNVPTGEVKSVEGSPYDIRKPKNLKDHLPLMPGGIGLDNCYCLKDDSALKLAARVEHPPSGRYMECHTTEPAINVYTAYYVSDRIGKQGATYGKYCAICLEAQHYNDSVHQPHFPSTILRPGESYSQKTVYKFGVL